MCTSPADGLKLCGEVWSWVGGCLDPQLEGSLSALWPCSQYVCLRLDSPDYDSMELQRQEGKGQC